MCLKHYMPFQPLYIITRNHCTQRTEAKALGIPAVEWNTRRNMSGEAMLYKMFVRIKFTLKCKTLCRAYNLCSHLNSNVDMMRPLMLVALWFLVHIELAKYLLFGFMSSCLSPKCERHNTSQNTMRANGASHASLVCHLVVVYVVWNNYCFFSYGTTPWLLCLAFSDTCLSE